ncbi:MAG: histidinol dehydrogenase [Pyrinomonadaceae bacterium]|nr:histidinol dehydrogenase [Pyrinomonadaceae bacterium]MCX7639489.1 histidinol dehydrogenase [Pyrinomonadaceae bacterium]MDW8304460.1 histidinol dehydrogenase [Acidobacteriota bacterium]
MMRLIRYPEVDCWQEIVKRPSSETADFESKIAEVLEEVKREGDKALERLTLRFEGRKLNSIKVSEDEFLKAEKKVSEKLKQAIGVARRNIEAFHLAQVEATKVIETMPGVFCWRRSVPIERVGLYVPAGSAPLFSTVLMLAIPAKIAGCKQIVLCSPADSKGEIEPATLYAARLCGIENVFKVGGAQAIAAMAFGTETIPKVYKIFGPGNQFVTEAKRQVVRFGVEIDMPAGPSEVAILADDSAVASFVAADLLSQAEHGPDSQVLLVSLSESLVNEVFSEIEKQLQLLPRKNIAVKALQNSRAVLFECLDKAIDFLNEYAAEHLIIATKDAEQVAERVISAGSVFIGNYSCESAGDYASGTNHTLPTGGYARVMGGVSVDSFVKKITFQKITAEGLKVIGPVIETMAEAEKLDGHKRAVSVRLERIGRDFSSAKSFSLERLVRENVKNLKPYSSARSEFNLKTHILLDANENSFGSPILPAYNRYPDPLQLDVKGKIAQMQAVEPGEIFLGNGSDEVIDLLLRIFCHPQRDAVIICPPTYGMYEVLARINEVKVRKVPLTDDFELDIKGIRNQFFPDTKLIFICSPNNPTGNAFSSQEILQLASEFEGLVIVDEAYAEFSTRKSLISEIRTFKNLVVLRTFSKAWGLAGLRVGMAFADARVIELLNKVKPPYNISQPSQELLLQALQNRKVVDEMTNEIIRQREWLSYQLRQISCVETVFPSEANFILVRFKDAEAVYRFLLQEGIVVRNRSSECQNCLRITVGTEQENKALVEALRRLDL